MFKVSLGDMFEVVEHNAVVGDDIFLKSLIGATM